MKTDRLVTVPEILHLCGVKSRSTLFYWQQQGIFPEFDRIGRRVGLFESKLVVWQDEIKKGGNADA